METQNLGPISQASVVQVASEPTLDPQLLSFDLDSLPQPSFDEIFSALDDSVYAIDRCISDGCPEHHTEEEHKIGIKANVDHLEQVLAKDSIKNSGRSLTKYIDAIGRGQAHLAS